MLTKANKITEVHKKELDKKHDCELVTGIFRMLTHTERTRGRLEQIPIRKYKDQGIFYFTARDGDKVTVPRYVADHINSLYTTITPDETTIDGKPICEDPIKVYRFSLDLV